MKHALPDMGLQLVEPDEPEAEAKPEMATPKQLAAFVGESIAVTGESWADVVKEQVPWQ